MAENVRVPVEKHPMQPYFGVNSSLYISLDTNSVKCLEQASIATDKGRYPEAQRIYDQDLSPQRLNPAVVLGRAELALKQNKVGLLFRILDEALEHTSKGESDLDEAEFRLMAVMRAFASFSHKGTCEPAVVEISRTQEWLKDTPVTEYNDIQVNYIRKYVLLVLFLALACNYIKDDAGFIPRPSQDWIMWQGLTDLRVSLLQRGMLNEALTLFKYERSRLPVTERLDAVRVFLAYVRNGFSLSYERSVWVDAELTLYLAQSFYERGEGETGAAELRRADALLDLWCSLVENQEKHSLTLAMDIKLASLQYRDFDEPSLYYSESLALLKLFKANCHAATTVCYGHAIEAASQLMTTGATGPYKATFYELLYERQEYQECVLEDIRGMLNDSSPLFARVTGYDMMDSNKVLEWLESFEQKYPEFDIPGGLMEISRRRRLIYNNRREREKQAREELRMEELRDKINSHIGVLVATRPPKTTILPTNGDPMAETMRAMDINEENFFMPWVDVVGKSEEARAQALQFMVKWMLFDFTSGIIEESEIRALLGTGSESEEDSSMKEQLEALSSDSAFFKLYLHAGSSFPTAIDDEQWSQKFKILESWLSRSSKPTFNGRQYLKVSLQGIRKDSVIKCRAPLHVRVLEIHRCISLVETLPTKVREVVSPQIILWRSEIADQHFSCVYPIYSKKFNCKEVGESLAIAVDISLELVEEFQKQGDLVQLAARQRTTGEMCLFKLNWMLLQPGRAISDPDLHELQETGLELLEKADEYLTPLLREATWSQGLDSVQERERWISTFTSWRIPQLAVQLLVAGGIPVDDSRRKRIWTWVQRSKARALAMAMGKTGRVPDALLQQIMTFEQPRLLYEEMLHLEQRIQAVEPQKRFALRRELDSHVKDMRKHKPLADLCDLKDGKALTLSDLDTLMKITSFSAVLVDWFYLHLDATDEGSILLLTAKSGSTPTISLLSTKPQKVSRWIDSNLNRTVSIYTRNTADLNTLVQPLVEVTKPGETLVFCASGNLHRIPLHSIDTVEDDRWQPLIYWNPIVYIHSHSLLRMSIWNAQAAAGAQSPLNPFVMNGIPDIPGNGAWAAGRASVQELADLLGVAPHLNSNGTKDNFLAKTPSSRLVHIHSHVEWTAADPLAHSIQFAPSPRTPKSADADIKLSAREIFALSLPHGTHVSLITCSGGLARVSPEDEVMGLVPALLYAGASSTISTLWPIKDHAGAAFTKSFYRGLEEARGKRTMGGEVGSGWIDIAKVFQNSVIERYLEETETGTMHWPAFVMHGFWRFWVPL